jgi:hypothetical protein
MYFLGFSGYTISKSRVFGSGISHVPERLDAVIGRATFVRDPL